MMLDRREKPTEELEWLLKDLESEVCKQGAQVARRQAEIFWLNEEIKVVRSELRGRLG